MNGISMNLQPLDLILALGLGLAIGWTGGDQSRRRKNANLHLHMSETATPIASEFVPLIRTLKQQRGILNDIHKRIMAVSKGLQKPAR
jgi:hypothetical protein